MGLVVQFLSMLGSEEENGGVKRMLGVCTEFERIAKAVLDKAEKDSSSRRKRKSDGDHLGKTKAAPPQPMSHPGQTPNIADVFSPAMSHQSIQQNGFAGTPMANHASPPPPLDYQQEFGNFGQDYTTPTNGMTPFNGDIGYTNNAGQLNSPLNLNSFQQPFVPQDLWQMPMTLEWDWADMTGGAYPSFENGIVGDPNLQNVNNQHLQHQPM